MVNLPNFFTLVRLVLAPFVAHAILSGNYREAIIIFFIAGLSDAIDGFLARRLAQTTRTGAYFDPIADKILLSVIYVSLGAAGAVPWWIVGVVLGRDLLILGVAASALVFTSHRKFPPSTWGKISTLLQISAALAVMIAHAGASVSVEFMLWLMVAGTIWSGFHYAWRALRLVSAKMN